MKTITHDQDIRDEERAKAATELEIEKTKATATIASQQAELESQQAEIEALKAQLAAMKQYENNKEQK